MLHEFPAFHVPILMSFKWRQSRYEQRVQFQGVCKSFVTEYFAVKGCKPCAQRNIRMNTLVHEKRYLYAWSESGPSRRCASRSFVNERPFDFSLRNAPWQFKCWTRFLTKKENGFRWRHVCAWVCRSDIIRDILYSVQQN